MVLLSGPELDRAGTATLCWYRTGPVQLPSVGTGQGRYSYPLLVQDRACTANLCWSRTEPIGYVPVECVGFGPTLLHFLEDIELVSFLLRE